ncbi:rolling circle replication-associated protein [Cohnella soli]|uniref:Replication-associated protein ORF2/G2P domain-containing protein n=1 Tax=Cohnella soli TaxID=425005 RepID=A0ABW0HVI2_9BACL
MNSYNCQMVKIGNCLRTKRYGRTIYEGGKNPRRSKVERSAEIAEIMEDPSLSKLEKLIHTAILEPSNKEERAGKRPDRTPKPGRLTLSERERFCHLMDRNFSEGHKFLTLTYEKEDVSLDESARDFENWVKRMRERYDDFKYLAVRSFQQRGTLHYHLLADLPTIPRAELADGTFSAIWGHGSVDLRRIYCLPMEERRNRLKQDLLKNLRNFKEDERSYGKRLFLQSKNLIVPPTIKGDFDELMERLKANGYVPKLMDSYSFETEFLGTIQLGTYWLTKQEAL